MSEEQLDQVAWDGYAAAALSGLLSGLGTGHFNNPGQKDLTEARITEAVSTAARLADAMLQQRKSIWG